MEMINGDIVTDSESDDPNALIDQSMMSDRTDDASGFHLVTMVTHSQHPAPMVQGEQVLTAHTDYVNKYPSTLQTTLYNFSETDTTPELCAGVVKASKVYPKNPSQHLADLEMLECSDELRPAFYNPKNYEKKETRTCACGRCRG